MGSPENPTTCIVCGGLEQPELCMTCLGVGSLPLSDENRFKLETRNEMNDRFNDVMDKANDILEKCNDILNAIQNP